MKRPIRVLLLEDRDSDAELVMRELSMGGFVPQWERVQTEEGFLDSLQRDFDVIISDYSMPQFNGMRALDLLKRRALEIPFILVSGTIGEDSAVDAMRLGATDYLLKDRLARLGPAVSQALEQSRMRKERKLGEEALRESEERFRQLAENIREVFWLTDPAKNVILYVSPAYETIWGRTQASVYASALGWLNSIHPGDAKAVRHAIKTKQAAGTYDEEYRIVRPDGSIRWIRDRAFPVRNGAGEIYRVVGVASDITERKRSEDAIRESEERMRSVLESALDCVVTMDHQGRIVEFNPAAEKTFGYKRHAAVGQLLADLIIPPALRERHQRGLAHYLSTGEAPVIGKRVEFTGMRSDLSEFPLELAITRMGSQEPPMFTGFIRDITERKQAETATREADQHLADIINSVEGIVWESDEATGRFTFVSEKAEKILGYPTGHWLSEPRFWEKHLHPDDREKTMSCFTAAVAQLHPAELEYRMIAADGRMVWFKDRVTVVSLPGRSIKHRGIMLDVTHRKLADMEARAGEAQIREQAKLLDLAHDAIMVRDMDDRVEFWNLGAERLYGWTAAEVRGKQAATFLHEEPPAKALAARMAVTESGKWSGECKHLRKGGGAVMVRSRWTLVRDEAGAPKSILIINTDITEQRTIEEQFLRAQRLESIGTLASGVAHDLNNILAPILMGAAVLRRTPMAEPDAMILSTMETCAQRGADIVKQVLTFARGAEGAHLLLEPAHLINDMAKIADGTFPKAITVQTSYLPSLWPIEGDPTQLHQILLNLCVNARDAMPAGGTLTISARNFPVDEHYASMIPGAKAGPHVLFEVKDTGMGIPREIIDKVFDPFFTTKEIGRGTGLGLSTVIGIAKSHGGFVSVESEIGRGTNFKVCLPARIDAPGTLEGSEPTVVPLAKGELLLIVDDEQSILQVARELLEGHGYQVLTAVDAPEALAIFAQRKDEIDLVLTDLAMPLMDGIALIRTLQKMKPGVCVVASTGQGSAEPGAHELPGLNVRARLAKPYNKETLLKTLHDALNYQTDKP
jgi:PAS domain S-box-containing protein